MKRENAIVLIHTALAKMGRAYGKPLFDEWVLFAVDGQEADLLLYAGPREDAYEDEFADDVELLLEGITEEQSAPGHFYFAREAEGAMYDAFLAVGKDLYVVFNNTQQTMADITSDRHWTDAQVYFVQLSERFQMDPLTV